MNVPISACSNCGEEISPKWIVCPICRHPASEKPAPDPTEIIDPVFHFGEILCIKCKKQIGPDTQICPHCHVPIIRRYCSGCHRLIPDHVYLCPYCHAQPFVKKGLGRVFKVAVACVLPFCLIFAYITFHRTTPPTKPIAAPDIDPQEPRVADTGPSEADFLQNAPAPQLIPKDTVPLAISPIEAPFEEPVDAPDLRPAPVSVPTNTVEVAPKKEKPKREEKVIVPVRDIASRGARLKQGRQLKDIGSRLMRQKEYSKAAYVLRDAIRAFPPETKDLSYGEALYILGYSLRMSGKPAEAIPVLKKALNFPFVRKKAAQELQSASSEIKKTQRVQFVKP
jgi:RNA polymerase subunit RPABC4/transcription elongation factor Spt4